MEEKLCILTSSGMEQLLRGLLCVPKGSKPISTTIIKSDVERRVHLTCALDCVEFSAKEMEQYCLFFNKYTILNSIGFNDGSAIYYAMISKKYILVTDMISAKLCKFFDIPFISLLPIGIVPHTGMKESQSECSLNINREPNLIPLKKIEGRNRGFAQNNNSMTG